MASAEPASSISEGFEAEPRTSASVSRSASRSAGMRRRALVLAQRSHRRAANFDVGILDHTEQGVDDARRFRCRPGACSRGPRSPAGSSAGLGQRRRGVAGERNRREREDGHRDDGDGSSDQGLPCRSLGEGGASSSRRTRATRWERSSAIPATGTDRGAVSSHSATLARHLASSTPEPVRRTAHSSQRYSALSWIRRRASRLSGWKKPMHSATQAAVSQAGIAPLQVGQLVGQHGALLTGFEIGERGLRHGDLAGAQGHRAGQCRGRGQPDGRLNPAARAAPRASRAWALESPRAVGDPAR